MAKTFEECLDIEAKKESWNDWDEVLNESKLKRTVHDIMLKAHYLYVAQISEIMMFNDKDEDEKLQEIKELIDQ